MLIQRKFLPAVLACGLAAVGNLFGAGFESPGAPDPSGANASVPGSRKWNEEEKEKCEALVEEDIRQVGEQNPKTLTDKVALAVAKSRTGESLAAENELRDLLAIYQRRQGPDHEETISCRTALAQLLKETRRPHEAVTEYRAVLEIRERTLGADDVEVARIKHLMADAHSSADEYPAAIALYRESQPIFERVLGPENAESLLNRSNLALALGQNREFAACEKDLRELLSIRERRS
jgi:tetratricopeptide (TPR) repeat protein